MSIGAKHDRNIKEIMPKINSAKLTGENRVYIHPVCALGGNLYKCLSGWKIAGWAEAPYESILGKHAIIYEKFADAPSFLDNHAQFETGLYWGHGDAGRMIFPSSLSRDE